jgi:hypothetical protein
MLENWSSAPLMLARNSRTGRLLRSWTDGRSTRYVQVGHHVTRSLGQVRSRRPGCEAVNTGRFPSVGHVVRDGRAGCGQTGRSPFVGSMMYGGRSFTRSRWKLHRSRSKVARQVDGRTVVCRTRWVAIHRDGRRSGLGGQYDVQWSVTDHSRSRWSKIVCCPVRCHRRKRVGR